MRRFLTLTMLATLPGCSSDGSTVPDRPVTGVLVAPAAPSLIIGQTVQFVATVSGGFSNTPVTWSISNPGVAALSDKGFATTLTPGTDTVTATAGGVPGTAVLKVTAGSVDRVNVCDRAVTASCSNRTLLNAVGTSVVVRASAFNVIASDISAYCVFQWTTNVAGIVSVTTSTDAAHHEALITRTGVGAVSVLVSCNGVIGVYTIDAPPTP